MTTSISGLNLRRVFGRDLWNPPEPFGGDGWRMSYKVVQDGIPLRSVIATVSPIVEGDPTEWIHASIANADGTTPPYEDLVTLHKAAFGNRYAYQCFVPETSHVNIHPGALHLWGRLDGAPAMPDFGALLGTI